MDKCLFTSVYPQTWPIPERCPILPAWGKLMLNQMCTFQFIFNSPQTNMESNHFYFFFLHCFWSSAHICFYQHQSSDKASSPPSCHYTSGLSKQYFFPDFERSSQKYLPLKLLNVYYCWSIFHLWLKSIDLRSSTVLSYLAISLQILFIHYWK